MLYCTALTVLHCTGVVVLAVPVFAWPLLPLDTLQPATVIIDPSNRAASCAPDTQSQVQLYTIYRYLSIISSMCLFRISIVKMSRHFVDIIIARRSSCSSWCPPAWWW